MAGSCLLGIHTSEISNCYPVKLAWQCVDIGGSQTVDLVGQVLELNKSHEVDEETTFKQDSSLKNCIYIKSRWVVAID